MDVSVIVLCYNQEKTISRTLDSILSQRTTCSYSIIIGDDASKDGTRSICEKYQKNHPEIIRLLDYHENYGVVRNYDVCLKQCSGKYIMECAGDDWWSNPDKMQLQFDYMEKHQECVLSYSGYVLHYASTGENIIMEPFVLKKPAFNSIVSVNNICAPTVCIRKSAMDMIGYSDFVKESLWCEDYPSWLALSLIGEINALNKTLVTYTVNSGSLFHVNTFEKRLRAIESDDKTRRYICKRAGILDKYITLLDDTFLRDKSKICIKYGNREEALKSLRSISKKRKIEYLKILVCSFPCLFKRYHDKYINSSRGI